MAENEFGAAQSGSPTADRLVASFREGSIAPLGELAERCQRYLLHVARRELHPDLRAKLSPSDLVQQTLIEVQRNFGNFRGETEGEFQAWLRQILLNQARGAARHYRNTSKRDVRRELPLEAPGTNRPPIALVDDIETPSKQAVASERMQNLAIALQRLPPTYREVIELRNQELLSFPEIGRRLARSAKAARSLWERAIEALRREVEGSDESY